jgi:hypothetical protein
MKETAVEWLCNQIYTIQVELEAGNTKLKNKIDQAKEMEKQQQGYSEEEVIKFGQWLSEFNNLDNESEYVIKELLERFKNK